MDKALVGLAEAIGALRAELVAAMAEGSGKGMQFALEPIELTFQTVVTKDGNGKIGWKIIEVGGSYQSQTTQSLTLRLTPVWRDKDDRPVRDFTIADPQLSAGGDYRVGPQPGAEPATGS